MGIFADPSKAFDLADQNNLLRKTNFYGIRGLRNRRQISQENKWRRTDLSDMQKITCVEPQESLLGPLHFIFYLPKYMNPLKSELYVIKMIASDFYSVVNNTLKLLNTKGKYFITEI